jgi:hypothetical protein
LEKKMPRPASDHCGGKQGTKQVFIQKAIQAHAQLERVPPMGLAMKRRAAPGTFCPRARRPHAGQRLAFFIRRQKARKPTRILKEKSKKSTTCLLAS